MSSFVAAFARAHWMLVGPFVCGFIALAILRSSSVSWRDALFWIVAVSIVVVRWIDVARLDGKTADGDPATPQHARRFGLCVTAGAVTLWVAAHFARGSLAA